MQYHLGCFASKAGEKSGLGAAHPIVGNPIFREMGLPFGKLSYPRISPDVWAVIFRVLWFLGYSANSESFRKAKQRVVIFRMCY